MKIFNQKSIFVILIIFVISCSKGIVNERGDNDTFETAEQILNTVNGDIEDASDKDYYFFEAGALGVVDIELNSKINTPLSMTIFDYNKNVIKHVADLFTNESSSNYTQMVRDIYLNESYSEELKYYVLIEGSDKLRYTLTAKEKEYRDEYENEPNDSFDSAQVFEFNYNIRHYSIDGYYSQIANDNVRTKGFRNKEVDIYKITNSIDSPLVVSLGLSSVPSVDTSISVYDENYNEIVIIDSNIEGDGEKLEKLILTPYSSYYILVYGSDRNNNIPYKLIVSAEDVYNDTELEPNNRVDMSQSIEYDIRYKGAIDHIFDTDYFMFFVSRETTINISYFKIDSESVNIKIVDFFNNELVTLSEVDGNEDILFGEGVYYLVFSFDKVEKGDFKKLSYEFSLSPLDITEFETSID